MSESTEKTEVIGCTIKKQYLHRMEPHARRFKSRSRYIGLLIEYCLDDREILPNRMLKRILAAVGEMAADTTEHDDDDETVFVQAVVPTKYVAKLDRFAKSIGQSRSGAAAIAIEIGMNESELFMQWLLPVAHPIIKASRNVQRAIGKAGDARPRSEGNAL
jgi:hypothetical protein